MSRKDEVFEKTGKELNPPAAPADMVMVPKEPTHEMLYAMAELDGWRKGDRDHPMFTRWRDYWYVALAAAPAPAVPADQWKAAIDDELVCCHIGTTDSFPDAKAALKSLIDWHVSMALDPAVSSDAQALIDKGKSAAPVVPLTQSQFADMVADASIAVDLAASPLKLLAFAREVLKAYGITGGGNG